MYRTLAVALLSISFSIAGFAKDVYLPIAGSANGFFTDTRIFNPSFDKDITIQARYLPAVRDRDNTNAAVKTITVAKRSMARYDDVVQSLFDGGGGFPLGAIRLTSEDDFIATQRIYADARTGHQKGTLGQFLQGLDVSAARRKGVVLQLKSGAATLGDFRTNWGGANPNPTAANVTLKLYDRNNALAATKSVTMQPYGVFPPDNIVSFFGAAANDLTDGWFSYESDQPIFVYGSVVDNGSVDPTAVAAVEDTGVAPAPPPQKTVTITARDWEFDVSQPAALNAGDQVKFIVSNAEGTHGFRLTGPGGETLIDSFPMPTTPTEFVVTLPSAGTYFYVCTNSGCGTGHFAMSGTLSVDASGAKKDTVEE